MTLEFDPQKAEKLLESGVIKRYSFLRWKRKGRMPAFYFFHHKSGKKPLLINGKTLREQLKLKNLKQTEFIKLFNERFDVNIDRFSVVRWGTGQNKPMKDYQRRLEIFFSEEG